MNENVHISDSNTNSVCAQSKRCECVRVLSGGRLTSTGPVRHQHVAVEAVALVTPICVHAPVFTRPRLQPTLIQICRQRERERQREWTGGQRDRHTQR